MAVSKSSWLVALGGVACGVAGLVVALGAQDGGPRPQCTNCPGTYLSDGEIKQYVAKAMKERICLVDMFNTVICTRKKIIKAN